MRRNRCLTAVLFLSLLIACRFAHAEEARRGLYLQGKEADLLPAPILGTSVEMRVTGIIARARVAQIFTNPTQEWVEGIYVFPLPEDAAVDSLKMSVGERVLEGVIQEKGEARQTYEAAKSEGTKATLIEQQRPDVFTTSVANIGPGETVEIAIELQQIIPWDKGRFRLRFPMVVAERYLPKKTSTAPVVTPPVLPAGAAPINPFAFHVDLAPGFPLGRIESPSHRIAVEKGKAFRYAVDLAEGTAPADSDFILEWSPAVGREPRAVFYSEEVDGEHYGLLMVMPPDAPDVARARLPRETVFIIDTSGSMEGASIEQARRALLLALDRLQPGDWFNVIQFNSAADALFSDTVPADPGTLDRARRYVAGLKADGGTNMLPALEIALRKSLARPGLVRQMVFITDGQVGNEPDIYRLIAAHLGERRLFTVAIGSAPNVSFLRKSAEIGRGTFTHISDASHVAERMGSLFAQLEAPMLRDLEVRWDDPAAEAWPGRVPDLYLGEPLVVTARRSASGPVAVSGRRGDEVWEDSFPAAAEIKGAGIHKLWARKKIESLEDSLRLRTGVDPDEVRRTVTDLGVRHHLVTACTSLVAVDVTPTAPAGVTPVSRRVPVNPPRASSPPVDLGNSGVEDLITVTAESPLLDERRISTGSIVSQTDLEKIPTSRDPWAVATSTPGVLTDRVNVGGNESGQRSQYVGPGSQGSQAAWSLDGLVITDMSALGSSPGYYDFDVFEEIQVTTGDAKETGNPELTDPAGFMKIIEGSKLTYEIGVKRPVADPVEEMQCPSRGFGLRVVSSPEGRSLKSWEPSKEAAPHFEAAEKLYAEKHYSEAAAEYRKGLALDPDFGLGWLYSGDIPFHQGDYESALQAYRRALALDPTLPQAHHFAAHALLKLGRLEEAETEYVQAVVYDPSYKNAWAGLEHLGRLAAFTVLRHEFSPPADMLGRRKGDQVAIAMDENAEWLSYLLCKAVWRNEPEYRRKKNGGQDMDESSWSFLEERECLASYVAGNLSLARGRLEEEAARKGLPKEEISEDQALAAAPEMVRHLHEVAMEGLIGGFIAVEYLGRRCPMTVSLLPKDVLDEAERYIRRFVLLRQKAGEGPR